MKKLVLPTAMVSIGLLSACLPEEQVSPEVPSPSSSITPTNTAEPSVSATNIVEPTSIPSHPVEPSATPTNTETPTVTVPPTNVAIISPTPLPNETALIDNEHLTLYRSQLSETLNTDTAEQLFSRYISYDYYRYDNQDTFEIDGISSNGLFNYGVDFYKSEIEEGETFIFENQSLPVTSKYTCSHGGYIFESDSDGSEIAQSFNCLIATGELIINYYERIDNSFAHFQIPHTEGIEHFYLFGDKTTNVAKFYASHPSIGHYYTNWVDENIALENFSFQSKNNSVEISNGEHIGHYESDTDACSNFIISLPATFDGDVIQSINITKQSLCLKNQAFNSTIILPSKTVLLDNQSMQLNTRYFEIYVDETEFFAASFAVISPEIPENEAIDYSIKLFNDAAELLDSDGFYIYSDSDSDRRVERIQALLKPGRYFLEISANDTSYTIDDLTAQLAIKSDATITDKGIVELPQQRHTRNIESSASNTSILGLEGQYFIEFELDEAMPVYFDVLANSSEFSVAIDNNQALLTGQAGEGKKFGYSLKAGKYKVYFATSEDSQLSISMYAPESFSISQGTVQALPLVTTVSGNIENASSNTGFLETGSIAIEIDPQGATEIEFETSDNVYMKLYITDANNSVMPVLIENHTSYSRYQIPELSESQDLVLLVSSYSPLDFSININADNDDLTVQQFSEIEQYTAVNYLELEPYKSYRLKISSSAENALSLQLSSNGDDYLWVYFNDYQYYTSLRSSDVTPSYLGYFTAGEYELDFYTSDINTDTRLDFFALNAETIEIEIIEVTDRDL